MLTIGITGGIGSGKTTVSKLFTLFGIPVFNSDTEAKKIVLGLSVKEKIIELLGSEAYLENNTYNSTFIAQKVFNDTTLLNQLNAIIHPAVKRVFEAFCLTHNDQKYILKESALLVEAGIYKELDKLITVVAPLELKIQRIQNREGWTDEEIRKRIKNQLSDEEKTKRSDFIILNNEQESIIKQVLAIHKQLIL